MPYIKSTTVDAIRNGVNIHDLVSTYVTLKKVGSAYKGLSPFTQEKTPSFFVYPDKGNYYCFSTSQGGDVFKFVQVKEGLSFPEAVEFIAHRFSIQIEYEDSKTGTASKEGFGLKKQIFDINEEAAAWFCETFASDTEFGKEARRYWFEERKFPRGSEKDLRIGIAPVDWSSFKKRLEKKYSFDAIAESGLFFSSKSKTNLASYMPRFRGRLMIPICDVQGRVCGFTARKTPLTPSDIDYEEGKYVNSPETQVFKKQNLLFNFDKARKSASEKDFFILVEGQIDTLRMYVSGFHNTVAGQGTAIGESQLMMIKRHAKKLTLMLDGDSAGVKAAKRVLPMCLKLDIDPSVTLLPRGEDPDTIIMKQGVDAIEKLMAQKLTPISFFVRMFRNEFANPSASDKRALLSEIYELVSNASSYVAQDAYLREAASALGAEYSLVAKDFLAQSGKSDEPQKRSTNKHAQVLTNAVHDALLICLNNPELVSAASDCLDLDWIDGDSAAERLFKCLLAYHRDGLHFDISEIEDEEDKNFAYLVMTNGDSLPTLPAQALADCLGKIHKNFCEKKIAELEADASSKIDEAYEEKRARFLEISKLKKLIVETKFTI